MVGIVALCLPLPSPVGATVDTGAWRQMKSGILKKKKKNWKMHLMMNKYLVLKMPLNQHAPAITFVSYTD